MRRTGLAALACVCCLSTAIAQQGPARDAAIKPAETGTATLSGTAVSAVTGQPIRRAVLTLSRPGSGAPMVAASGDRGEFTFRDLPAGQFLLGAAKPGYIGIMFGAAKLGRPGKTIPIESGEQKTGLTVTLMPAAAISGTVRDSSGEPFPGVRVVALRYGFGFQTGERTLMQTSGGFGVQTDDHGLYRIQGLAPDDYYVVVSTGDLIRGGSELREVSAAEVAWAAKQLQGTGVGIDAPAPPPPAGRAVDYAPMFYPGVFTAAAASAVTVKAGEDRSDIDVVLDRVPTSKIVGVVISPSGGTLPPNLQVNVIAHDTVPGIPFSGFGNARVDKDGQFSAAGLPPGDYTITVRVPAGRGGAPTATASLYGLAEVSVSGGDVPVTVTLQTGVTVSGHVTFDATTAKAPADLSRLRVNLNAARSGRTPTLGVPAATVDANGDFTFVGVTPARYTISSSAPEWRLRSAAVHGQDAIETPFEVSDANVGGVEITFSDRHTEIGGSLLTAGGQPAPDCFIIAFPVDRSLWSGQTRRIQSQRPLADGHFSFKDIPPGDYYLAAVLDVEPGEWFDPAFLSQLVAASTKVTLHEGEALVQSLRMSGKEHAGTGDQPPMRRF